MVALLKWVYEVWWVKGLIGLMVGGLVEGLSVSRWSVVGDGSVSESEWSVVGGLVENLSEGR